MRFSNVIADSENGTDVHRHVSWMVPADVVFLQFLYSARTARGEPSIQTPKTMGLNTGYSREHASTRAKVLVEHDLVEQLGVGEYRLTEFGERVLDQEVPLEELEPDE
ncbi:MULTISPECIES: hypothetical protein [Actinomycetes]|uniref:hypothetical protein n=1 Tax=Aeromicrobium tamlense TaxID=375541 RepID=UPI0031E12A8C